MITVLKYNARISGRDAMHPSNPALGTGSPAIPGELFLPEK